MQKLTKGRRPSPALAVALTALVVGATGTAEALPGVNLIGANDLRRGSVGTRAIRNNRVSSADVKNNTLGNRDIKDDVLDNSSIRNTDLQASTANTAGFATNAGHAASASDAGHATTASNASAVQGQTVRKFSFVHGPPASGTTSATLVNAGGLVIAAGCSNATGLTLVAVTGSNHAILDSTSSDGGTVHNEVEDHDWLAGAPSAHDLLPDSGNGARDVGTTHYQTLSGQVVTVQWLAAMSFSGPGPHPCIVNGHVIAG